METKTKCTHCQDLCGRVTYKGLPYCLYCLSQVRSKEHLESKYASIVGQKVERISQPAMDEIEIEFENGTKLLIDSAISTILKLYTQGTETKGSWVRTDATKLNKRG